MPARWRKPVSATSAAVARPLTTSTSGMSGAGLKKCMPDHAARVLHAGGQRRDRQRGRVAGARIVSGLTTTSSSRSRWRLTPRSSTIASMTNLALTSAPSAWTTSMRAVAAASAASRSILPFAASAGQRLADPCLGLVRGAHAGVEQAHAMTGLRGDLRDAGPHGTCPDDGDFRGVGQRVRHVICPVNRGGRLSRNAATPSR